jgi:hypothetical protein
MNKQFYKVEFDPTYRGGNYSGVGNFALIPAELVDAKGMSAAFLQTTGHSPVHIVHYAEDLRFNADGTDWIGEGTIILDESKIQVPRVPAIQLPKEGAIELDPPPAIEIETPIIEVEPDPVILLEPEPVLQATA